MTKIEQEALEFAAERLSSDWPERCQEIVRRARAALASLEAVKQEPQSTPPMKDALRELHESLNGARRCTSNWSDTDIAAWGRVDRALLALTDSVAPVQEQLTGWKWVPVEPTEEMVRAACDCQEADPEDGLEAEVYHSYRAMLAAAPSPGSGT